MNRILSQTSAALVCALALFIVSPATAEIPILSKRMTEVEVITWLDVQPRDLAITADQRLIFSITPTKTIPYHILQLRADGRLEPYPSKEWSGPLQANGVGLVDVVAIDCDDQGRLAIGDRASDTTPPRVIVWDMNAGKLIRVVNLPRPRQRQERPVLQDIIFDAKHKMVVALSVEAGKQAGYSKPLIYVVRADGSGEAKPFRLPDLDPRQIEAAGVAEKATLAQELPKAQADLNIPLAIDPDCEWIYSGWPNKQVLIRIRAEDLANPDVAQDQLKSLVQVLGDKPLSFSMAADRDGVVYFADQSKNGIGLFTIKRQYRMLAVDKILASPTCIRLGLDGYVYVAVDRAASGEPRSELDMAQPRFLIARHKKSALK